jgi:hypothetical protein
LDAVARKFFCLYDFKTVYEKPIMDDLLAAIKGPEGETWNYRKNLNGQQETTVPILSYFSESEWKVLKSLSEDCNKRLFNGHIPMTIN